MMSIGKRCSMAMLMRDAASAGCPRYRLTTIKSTSESPFGMPYAYEPKRMIRSGLNASAIWSTTSSMSRAAIMLLHHSELRVWRQRRGDVGEQGGQVGDLLDRGPVGHAVPPRERVALDAAGGDFAAELVEGEGA